MTGQITKIDGVLNEYMEVAKHEYIYSASINHSRDEIEADIQ